MGVQLMQEKDISTLASPGKSREGRGKSILMSPNPKRLKYMTELFAAFSQGKLTFADVAKLDRKKLKSIAEQGFIKLKHGRYDEARKIFEVLSFVDSKNYFHHLALGGTYQKLKKWLDASFQYSECLKYDPQNTNALVNRGEIFLKHKNYKKAAEDFRTAILIDKEGRDIFANRARSLVIAIKRSLAREKGESKATALPDSPSKRKKIAPLALMGGKARKKK